VTVTRVKSEPRKPGLVFPSWKRRRTDDNGSNDDGIVKKQNKKRKERNKRMELENWTTPD
jgi:hypothetical protein